MALVVLGAASACKREPTFDERYASAQKVIRDKAGELDRDMSTRAAEADAIAPEKTRGANISPARIAAQK